VFGAASILGPAVGGLIVDHTTWRWIFYVNLPVGAIAFAVISATMPRRAPQTDRSIDWVGAGLLAWSSTALLLGLVWGGGQYSWTSSHVLAALAAAAMVFVFFLLYERTVPETILPFGLLRNRVVASSLLCMALVGMAMFGTISFVPLFVQGVIGTSATSSGVVLTPLMLGAVTASFISGQWVSRSGRTRPNAITGPIFLTAGMFLLWRMDMGTTNGEAARNMIVAGIGLGLMMQVFVLVVQNAVPPASIGSATALTQFSRSIGGTLGVTLMGVIVNQRLPSQAGGGAVIHRLHGPIRAALAHALRPAFFAAMCVSALVLPIVIAGIREVRLRHGFEDVTEEISGPAAAPPTRAE
jgi:predicted MFS family arabinose efflux permease